MNQQAIDVCFARLPAAEGVEPFPYDDSTGKRVSLAGIGCTVVIARDLKVRNEPLGTLVTCKPNGNLSIGIGINLELGLQQTEFDYLISRRPSQFVVALENEGLAPEEMEWLTRNRLNQLDEALSVYYWYGPLDDVRKSVFVEVAFNMGVHNLLGFVKCLAATAHGDWKTAQAELMNSEPGRNPGTHKRYEHLSELLLNGG